MVQYLGMDYWKKVKEVANEDEEFGIKTKMFNATFLFRVTDKKDLPNLFEPIKVVVAGGTSLAGGFVELLDSIIKEENDFPIPVSEVKHAEEPLYSVSHGLFQAADLNISE